MLNLYVFPPSPRAFKVIALAAHLGIDYEKRIVDLTKGEQRRPEFTALNPNQRMPVMEEDGFVLWESNAILQYLADKKPTSGLLPTDTRRSRRCHTLAVLGSRQLGSRLRNHDLRAPGQETPAYRRPRPGGDCQGRRTLSPRRGRSRWAPQGTRIHRGRQTHRRGFLHRCATEPQRARAASRCRIRRDQALARKSVGVTGVAPIDRHPACDLRALVKQNLRFIKRPCLFR